MKAIYASKLFRASTRKEKIRAALSDPINVELVKQLRSYLDKDELASLDSEPENDVEDVNVADTGNVEETSESDSDEVSRSSSPGGSPHHHLSKMMKDDDLGTVDEGFSDLEEPSDTSDTSDDESVEEAVDINNPVTDENVSDTIQATLNSNPDTEGVRRVNDKGSEFWIYYNDDVNLNDVMECVISECEKHDLDFNRFARTENAIVFTR